MRRERVKEPNALVVDVNKGWGFEYIEEPSGKLRRCGDKAVYYMIRDKDGNLKPKTRPETIDTQPEKLYRALNWPEVPELFKLNPSLMDKLQTGATIALVGIMIFFIFLILSEKGVI